MAEENQTTTSGDSEEMKPAGKPPVKKKVVRKAPVKQAESEGDTSASPPASEEERIFLMPEEEVQMSEEAKRNILREKLEQIGVLGSGAGESLPHTLWQKLQSLGLVASEGGSDVQPGRAGKGAPEETHDKGFWSQIALGMAVISITFLFFRAVSHKPPEEQKPVPAPVEAKLQPEATVPDWAKARIERMTQLREQFSAEMEALRQEQASRAPKGNAPEMPEWLRQHMERIEQLREEMRLEMESLRRSVLEHRNEVPPAAPVTPESLGVTK